MARVIEVVPYEAKWPAAFEAEAAAATEHRDTIVGYMRRKAAFMTDTISAARQWADRGADSTPTRS